MSMSVYTHRADATEPIGSFGPLDEIGDMYSFGHRRLDPTPEQELEAGWCNGPNLANYNMGMVLRSLDIPCEGASSLSLDPNELKGRLLVALAVPPVEDDGQPTVRSGNMWNCGVPPGYFARVYTEMLDVCDQALAWNTKVTIA